MFMLVRSAWRSGTAIDVLQNRAGCYPVRSIETIDRWEITQANRAFALVENMKRLFHSIQGTTLNGAEQEGFKRYQVTQRTGRRWSTARGYLRPARKRPNLTIETRAFANRALFEGRRAVGVEYQVGDETRMVCPKAEVILALGAFNSPQLLQLYGVGPAALLREHGIDVVADMPGVGADMQDHYLVRMLNDVMQSRMRSAGTMLRYLLFRRGMIAMASVPTGGFFRSDPSLESPDLQHHIVLYPNGGASGKHGSTLHEFSGLSATIIMLRPESQGSVEIGSANPREAPLIKSQYLSADHDSQALMRGVREASGSCARPGAFRGRTDRARRGREGGGGPAPAGPWPQRAAGGRCLGHAGGHQRQHECTDDHDRGEGIRHDPGGCTGRISLPGVMPGLNPAISNAAA
jgi:choline dehydrogenase-like flavoprotein